MAPAWATMGKATWREPVTNIFACELVSHCREILDLPVTSVPVNPFSLSQSAPSYSAPTQVLMLYYVLLYEHVRLTHTRTLLSSQRKVLRYSKELLAEMPIKFLLRVAERDQVLLITVLCTVESHLGLF